MKLVLFDFDGTLTTKDTFIEFIKFCKGKAAFWIGFILTSPVLVLYLIHLIKNWKAKEAVLKYFFKGIDNNSFQQSCQDFALNEIDRMLRPEAIKRLKERKETNSRIIIITASAEDWIRPWSERHNIELIGTKLEVLNNKLTGRISGKNCYGIEKVNRIKAFLNLADYDEIEVFGDSKGDAELMKIATKQFYRSF